MRVIDADEAVKIAERSYDMWNMAMAAADTQREINLVYKRQELCKAVEFVVKHCPTIDTVKHGKWLIMTTFDRMDRFKDYEMVCSCCNSIYRTRSVSLIEQKYRYCPACGARMDAEDGE